MSKIQFQSAARRTRQRGAETRRRGHGAELLLHIGPSKAFRRDRAAEFYYRAFHDIIGPEGTMLVHTPFEAYGRYNERTMRSCLRRPEGCSVSL